MCYTQLQKRLNAPKLSQVTVDRIKHDASGEAVGYTGGAFPVKQIVLDSIKTPALKARVLWEAAFDAGLVATVWMPDSYTVLAAGNSLFFLDNGLDEFALGFTWDGAL